MESTDLRSYAARSRALVDADAPTTLAETRRWLVAPLLSSLGWSLESSGCETAVELAGVTVEYLLSVDGTPALLVAVESFPDDLRRDRERDLRRAMAAAGIDRAVYTNGRRLCLLAGIDDPERFACDRSAIPDHAGALRHVSEPAVRDRLERETRRRVAGRLAARREDLARTLADELESAANETSLEFDAVASAFVSDLVEALLEDGGDSGAAANRSSTGSVAGTDSTGSGARDAADADVGTGADTDDDGAPDLDAVRVRDKRDAPADAAGAGTAGTDERGADVTSRGVSGSEAEGDDGDDEDAVDAGSDGEYVVRFFADRGSIGAVGHSDPERAMVAAAEFLFDRGLSGIRVPWTPDGSDEPVIVDRSAAANADATRYRTLSNGYGLDTSGPDGRRANRLRALAERAGFRVMLGGDWDSSRDD